MSGKVGPVKPVNHTSWVAVVTPTDRPKSVRNRCVIELFCGVVCVVTLPFWHFCWCRGFCHRTESDPFLFLLHWIWTGVKLWRHFGPSNEFHSCSFHIAAPIEYKCNRSRWLNQLSDAFVESGRHFPDACALFPDSFKSAYFGGWFPPLYRWNEYSWCVFLLEGCRSA